MNEIHTLKLIAQKWVEKYWQPNPLSSATPPEITFSVEPSFRDMDEITGIRRADHNKFRVEGVRVINPESLGGRIRVTMGDITANAHVSCHIPMNTFQQYLESGGLWNLLSTMYTTYSMTFEKETKKGFTEVAPSKPREGNFSEIAISDSKPVPPPESSSPKVGDTVFYTKTGWRVEEIATLYCIKAGATKIWVRPHQVSMTPPDTPASS